MKLSSSTGDFIRYESSIADAVRQFKNTKFKYINLEQTKHTEYLFSESEDEWKRKADEWAEAAAYAGVTYAMSHAPCLHTACLGIMENPNDEAYHINLRAIRRSIEVCHVLGIDRTVVHACTHPSFTATDFYKYNKKFYSDMFDLMEKYNISVLTENWDNSQSHFSTGKEMRDFIDDLNHPLLAACWDTAHGNIDPRAREIGQYQNIVTLGDKLKGLHISDNFGDCHHHSWPFAGIINFDSIMQGLLDVNFDGFFNFEASYTLLHHQEPPRFRQPWEHNGEMITKLLDPSVELKKKAVDLLYETGKYILGTYDCFEE